MMSETIIDKPVVDTYKEHSCHTKRHNNCSECYREHPVKSHSYHGINSERALGEYERFNNPIRD